MAKKILIGLGVLVLVIGVVATVDLVDQQPRLPVTLAEEGPAEVMDLAPEASAMPDTLAVGDRILSVDNRPVPNRAYLEFLLDAGRAGQQVKLTVERRGQTLELTVPLVRSLQPRLLAINVIVALAVWATGFLILIKGAFDIFSLLVFGMGMALSAVMWVYWPENALGLSWGSRLSWFLNNGLYPFTVAFLLHFSMVFPEGGQRPWVRKLAPLIYLPTVAIATALITTLGVARSTLEAGDVARYQFTFVPFRIYLAVYTVLSLCNMVYNYVRATQLATRQKLKWLFWGYTIGIAPHILLYELPVGLGYRHVIPEELSYLFVLFCLAALLIAMIRYRLLDVDLVINRSIVYAVLTLFAVLTYLVLVGLGDWVATNFLGISETAVRVMVVLLLAAAFAPVRSLAQKVVDRVFFRQQHDQRLALMEFSSRLARTLDIQQLVGDLTALLSRVIPVESQRVFVKEDSTDELKEIHPLPAAGAQPALLRGPDLDALGFGAHHGAFVLVSPSKVLQGTSVLVPLRMDKRLVGLLALGPKRSGESFRKEDLKFITAVADQTTVAFENARAFQVIRDLNIGLEQKVFERTQQLAQANDRLAEQYTRLQQLDELKEALTRMVVHDLKNPVGTIMLGLEFLDLTEEASLPENVRHTLEIITHTARDMQDLIANLLEVTRLEEGKLELKVEATPLRDLLEEGLRRVKVVAQSKQLELKLEGGEGLKPLVDRSLMTRVLVNLLVNAVKFATRESCVDVRASVRRENGEERGLQISVANCGPTIPPEYQEKIFEKFFQVDRRKLGGLAGSGLGLAFCKMVVEAHGGRIRVDSPPVGKPDGASFTVLLPQASGAAPAPGVTGP